VQGLPDYPITEKTKCLLIVSWDFRCEITDEEFDEWYYTSVRQVKPNPALRRR